MADAVGDTAELIHIYMISCVTSQTRESRNRELTSGNNLLEALEMDPFIGSLGWDEAKFPVPPGGFIWWMASLGRSLVKNTAVI